MNRAIIVGFFAAILLAIGLRCPDLDRRPMHGDEAVHAIKFRDLWEKGEYRYNPDEYHGPTLYYFTYALSKVSGAPEFSRFTETTLRVVPVVFGVALILLIPLIADGLGRWAAFWAGLFTAVSPAMVYYSRYYIHEILLVFFAFLTIAAGWRYWQSGRLKWAILAGAGIGLMHATKETFVFSMVAGGGALIVALVWGRAMGEPRPKHSLTFGHAAAIVAAWFVMVVIFFSSFFTNWNGIMDSVYTYIPWFKRAAGASPHIHEWSFYFTRLGWFHVAKGPVFTELLILGLSLVGLHAAVTGKGLSDGHRGFLRFLGFYTVGLTAIYCLIGYKTPWCALNFYHGMILLAGVGAAALVSLAQHRWLKYAVVAGICAGAIHLGIQSSRANTDYCADRHNPYVYAHTSEDLLNLVSTVETIVKASPNGNETIIQVIAPEDDYWPLPWYFRKLKNHGYYNSMPDDFGPIVIASPRLQSGAYSTLLASDVPNPVALGKTAAAHVNPIAEMLWAQLPDSTKSALTNAQPLTDTNALRIALARSLNNLVVGYPLFKEERFTGVNLRERTLKLVQAKPIGEEAALLNRMLLEDAFAGQVRRKDSTLDGGATHTMAGLTELRPQVFLQLYVSTNLWQRYIQSTSTKH